MSPSPSPQPTNSSSAPEAYYWQADDDWATNMEDMQKYEAIFTTDRTLSCWIVFSSTRERMAQFFRRRNTEAEPVGNSGNSVISGSSSNSSGNSTGEIPQALEDDPSPTAKGSSTLSASAGSWALGSPLKTARDGRNRPSRTSSSRSSRQTLERLSDEALVQLIQDSQQQEVQGGGGAGGGGAGGGGGEEVPGVDAIPNPMRVADSAVETHEEL